MDVGQCTVRPWRPPGMPSTVALGIIEAFVWIVKKSARACS
jgi:hypothetical protein